jgi:hypothetical protein
MICYEEDLMSNLVEYAKAELASLAGKDGPYDGMIAEAVVDLVKVFAEQGHSGGSASMTLALFKRVAAFQPIGPLTGADDEWGEPLEHDGSRQNRRCFTVFKRADGTAFDSNGRVFREPGGSCFVNSQSRVDVTFPYTPKVEYVDRPAQ